MPKLVHRIPAFRRHHASGQGIVNLRGRDIYLGPYDEPESRAACDRLIAEWLASHRASSAVPGGSTDTSDLTINEIFLPYWAFAQQHYRKNDAPTSELALIGLALRPLIATYGKQSAQHFGPLGLKAYRR